MHRGVLLALVGSIFVASSCSDSVSPADRALDGSWSTGHTLSGLEMALNLTWTHDHVSGTGNVNAIPAPSHCGNLVVADLTTITLAANRPSPTEIHGTMTIGSGGQATFEGSLTGAGAPPIQGTLVASDGTQCAITLFQGLVP